MTVGFFSLEMSKEQLFMRMLTSEARIDAHRFRTGYLNEKDYGRLSHALGTLAEARVFIDDTASIGVLEMRAKARRLKAEHGLHLLIIDYIQLMQGRGRFESRQQELASISRSLKGLAKELQRPDRRAVAAVARARDPLRPPPAALGPARVRRARAGRRRRDVHLPRRAVSRRRRQAEPEERGHRRDHHRQAAQRPDRHGQAGVHQGAHPVREPRTWRATAARGASRRSRRDRRSVRPSQRVRPRAVDLAPTSLADRARSLASPQRRPPGVIAVVKANAYGHGAAQVGAGARSRRARRCSRAPTSRKAIVLREAGVRAPILVFGALSVSDLDGVFTHGLTPTISTPSAPRARCRPPRRGTASRLRCHLKIDTGMNRLGFRHDNLRADAAGGARRARNLAIDAVYTHFATADNPEHPRSPSSASGSRPRCALLPALGIRRASRHAANSAALLRDERVWYDFVRPGLLLYGIVPPPLAATLPLRPALSLHSRIVAVKGLRPGEGDRLRPEDGRRSSRARSRSSRPATPTASTCGSPGAATCSSAAAARRSSARCAWT